MSGLLTATEKSPVKDKADGQRAPAHAVATAVPWNGVDTTPVRDSNAVISAVASPIAVNTGLTVVAQPEEISYEVVSCRVMGAGEPKAGGASLIDYGSDINGRLLRENHRKAKERLRQEEANLRKGNKPSASELNEVEKLRRAQEIARNRLKEEERNIDIGNRATIASSVEGEKSLLHVQVPLNATPGMLLTVDMPAKKKGAETKQITFALPAGAKPGGVIELVIGVQAADEAAVLAKMEKLRLEAEERVRREAEQEEYSYKGLGDGEYEYKPPNSQDVEEEYTYGG